MHDNPARLTSRDQTLGLKASKILLKKNQKKHSNFVQLFLNVITHQYKHLQAMKHKAEERNG